MELILVVVLLFCTPIIGNSETNYNGFSTWMSPVSKKHLQSAPQADIVVSKDGSGEFTTIGQALAAAPNRRRSGRFVIRVKAGTYEENVRVGDDLNDIMMLGDAVKGRGFIARGITFRNTAGPQNQQAVALRSSSQHSVFYQCSFEGYQDTLYVHAYKQFYRECDIYGTVDIIFGNAAAVFQNCNIYVRRPPNKTNTLTAHGRDKHRQKTGISFHNCRVIAASDLKPVQSSVRTYLGRPWKKYSRTVFMKTYLDNLIDPAGWISWNGNFPPSTLYYGEYMNTGPGSSTANRVNWTGYHVITSATEASKFTVAKFIVGGSCQLQWLSPVSGKLLQSHSPQADIVVAQDESGEFRTTSQALAAASNRRSGRFVIRVKAGTYQENVRVGKEFNDITILGDGIRRAIITGSRSAGGEVQLSSQQLL
ncbi:hypothetical protein Tsubulata_025448, partial [Turnera subulata]